jgi:hypothetical protein
MTSTAVEAFFIAAQRNAELGRRVSAVTADTKEAWAAEIARMARDEGYVFEPSEVAAAIEAEKKLARELGDSELEHVSGGSLAATDGNEQTGIAQYSLENAWPTKYSDITLKRGITG